MCSYQSVIIQRIDSVSAARTLFAGIADAREEMAAVAYLTRDRVLLGMRHVQGGRSHVHVDMRTLAIDALSFGAEAVVMAHNHPSGDPTPSRADIMLVKHTARTLDGITIRLIDHLVLAGPHTVSLHQMGLL